MSFFLIYLSIGGYLLEEMVQFLRHLLGLFGGEIPSGREGLMKHPHYFHAFLLLKMEEHILAHDKTEVVANGLKRQEVVFLEYDSVPDQAYHFVMSRLAVRYKIFFEYLFGDPLEFIFRVNAILYDSPEGILFIDIRCVEGKVFE